MQSLADLDLWAGTVACGNAGDQAQDLYKVRAADTAARAAAASGQRGPHERLCSTLNSTLWTHFALQEAFGWASRELQAPLLPNLRMPVGSNTKAMVAAAMYQLQQQGLLNVSASAADFLDPKDFPERKGGCLGVCARGVRE